MKRHLFDLFKLLSAVLLVVFGGLFLLFGTSSKSSPPIDPELREQLARAYEEKREKEEDTQRFWAKVRSAVAAQLKDPDSARYGRMFVSRKNGTTICGMVNSKNSFGGYTGEQPFVMREWLKIGETAITDWNKYCAGKQI